MNLLDSLWHLLAITHVIIGHILNKLLPAAAIAYKAIFFHLNDGLLIALILHYTALLLLRFCLLNQFLG